MLHFFSVRSIRRLLCTIDKVHELLLHFFFILCVNDFFGKTFDNKKIQNTGSGERALYKNINIKRHTHN